MKSTKGIILVTLLILFIIYAIFELGKYISGPEISLISPKNLSTTASSTVEYVAKIKNGAFITINDRQVYADAEGNLHDSLLLMSGYNIVKTVVKDKFGRQVENQTVIYKEK